MAICWTCSTPDRNVHHKGKCPVKKREEKRMAKKNKSRADKAEKLIASVDKSVAKAQKRLRHGETLLIDLEDRAQRRQDRRGGNR